MSDALAAELRDLLHAHAAEYLPYYLFYSVASYLIQFVVPYLSPGAFDALLAKEDAERVAVKKKSDAEATSSAVVEPSLEARRARAAISARTSAVSSIMAIHVASLSLYGLLTPSVAGALSGTLEAEVPLTRHLCNVAVAFFLWDLSWCWDDPVYIVHGLACLAVFAGSLRPFLHHMAMVTLFFEASTPFLHWRAVLIQCNQNHSPWFAVANNLFAGTFFVSRIAHGLWACFQWWLQVEGALASGVLAANREPMVRMYQVLCLLLSGLNVYWFCGSIVPSLLRKREK